MIDFSKADLDGQLECRRASSISDSNLISKNEGISTSATDQKHRIEKVLYRNLKHRLLSSHTNAAWQILHGAIPYGESLPLEVGSERISALEYLLGDHIVEGWELAVGEVLPTTGRRGLKARLEPGSYVGQGHVDQWLAYLSLANIPLTRTITFDNQQFTLLDWARQAQWDVPENPVHEYSWTLIALTRYFPDEESWVARDGKTWTFESLAEFEAKQDLTKSPCGGMHRLTGLVHVVKHRQYHGRAISGGWKLADDKIKESIERIRGFQNADGTFSTNHTDRPGSSTDLSVVISATGHTLEFLAFALDDEQIQESWVQRSVDRLCKLLEVTEKADLDCGGLYHALSGLKVYYSRRFGRWELSNLPLVSFAP